MMNQKNKADYGINPDNPLELKEDGIWQLAQAESCDMKREFKGVRYS
jgi:hypothetical protein